MTERPELLLRPQAYPNFPNITWVALKQLHTVELNPDPDEFEGKARFRTRKPPCLNAYAAGGDVM